MIRPNRATIGLAGLVLAMFYAGLTQNNSASFLVGFVLLGLALISALHAWTNLRGVEAIAEPIAPVFEGEPLVVPVRLRTAGVKRRFAVCVTSTGAVKPGCVAELSGGKPVHVEVMLPPRQRGHYQGLTLAVSSLYPLGFFTARRRIRIEQPHYVYPRPEGELPLPADDLSPVETQLNRQAEGDDFIGTREWQRGESMRHVDWKAVARGQRLMVKQWAGGANPYFILDEERLAHLPAEARLKQLARWVVTAERRAAAYELRLRHTTVPLGRGERQMEQCLRRLAEAPREETAGPAAVHPAKTHEAIEPLPVAPVLALCAILIAASVPLWEQAPAWTSGFFVASAVARAVISLRKWPLVSTVWRYLVVVLVGTAFFAQYTGVFNVEAGFGVMLILTSLKLLETRTARDFQVLLLLGFFLGLCGLFMAQDLARALYVILIFAALAAAGVQLQLAGGPRAMRRAWRISLTMLAQSAPLTVLLFLFVPRPAGEFRAFPGSSGQTAVGMSDEMKPGSIASLAAQTGRAFRVSFPGMERFPVGPNYWRGVVLWRGNGLDWSRGLTSPLEDRRRDPNAERVRQVIQLEPHNGFWLFALDKPVSGVKDASYMAGGTISSSSRITSVRVYEVVSQPRGLEESLPEYQRQAALRPPPQVSPKVQALADSFRSGAANDAEIVRRGIEFFALGKFQYSFMPGTYASGGLEEFLFTRRSGFCEHYASSFATLMRLAGVPSRVVLGYLGGEESHYGHYMIVNQSDAHAWCEVWLQGRGWVRQDPTAAAVPDGISTGLYSYLASQQGGGAAGDAAKFSWGRGAALREVRMIWDAITLQWDLHVLTFTRENQQDFLAAVGMGLFSTGQLLFAAFIVGAAFMAALTWWMRRSGKAARDRAELLFQRFCRRLAAAGFARPPAEPPLAYATRAAGRFPAQARELRKFGEAYAEIRYGKRPPQAGVLAEILRRIGRLDP
jgi:transglutaminase-like putative cysteine protease/uncharacterized protein (DUF58 family)